MLQRLPKEENSLALPDSEEAWHRAVILLASCTSKELLDFALPIDDLLFRLFHEDGVRVFAGHAPHAECRCSRERVKSVLQSLPPDDRSDLDKDGMVEVTCEFCNSVYRFTPEELAEG
jgi:molecular chaperone Hsp33